MAQRILTLRELNRATLARQLLLERAALAPLAAIKQLELAGLQGQLANPPYMGLWSRLQAFKRADLTCLLEQRAVVRTTMMRRTLHLTTAEDYLHFKPALQTLHARNLDAYFSKWPANGLVKEHLLAEIQTYLQEKPRTLRSARRSSARCEHARARALCPRFRQPRAGLRQPPAHHR